MGGERGRAGKGPVPGSVKEVGVTREVDRRQRFCREGGVQDILFSFFWASNLAMSCAGGIFFVLLFRSAARPM